MKNTLLFIVLSMLFISGCATTQPANKAVDSEKPRLTKSQEETWGLMLGKWYGDQPTKDGGRKQWVVERLADGTYIINFRSTRKDGKKEDSAEVGQWGVSGPVYFSLFRGWVKGNHINPSNPSDPYNYDAYRIIQLDKNIFEYEHFSTGNRYTLKRVPSDFQFPE